MILIVDDNQENVFSLQALLELNNFRVHTASSGEEALKLILKNSYSYSLIILDVQMPEMDGFEVAETILSYSKTKDIPIVFLSAVNTHKKYIARGYAAGGVDYITKPVDADILLLKIKTFYKLSEQKRQLIEKDNFLREEIEFRRQAENELEQKVEEFKSTLESLPHMAFTTCRDGNIEFVNHLWFNYNQRTDQFPEADNFSIVAHIKDTIASGKQSKQEMRLKMPDTGEYRFHVLCFTPVIKDKKIVRWVGIFTDIHEQKLTSQTLEKKVDERTRELIEINKKLEASNTELQKFAFIASHDLQEPLRKIQIFSDMIIKRYINDSFNTTKLLQKIIESAAKMSTLIRNVLEYSRLPDKNFYEMVDPNVVVNDLLQDFEWEIKSRNANVHVDPLPTMEVIPGQIRQVFQNLLTNALKFSKDTQYPEIHIKAERVDEKSFTAESDPQGQYCRIVFQDNGIGFDPKFSDKIFEIFQRLNQREGAQGTGIGLAIVKKVIDTHNGIITVESHENQGAKFIIVLPVKQSAKVIEKTT